MIGGTTGRGHPLQQRRQSPSSICGPLAPAAAAAGSSNSSTKSSSSNSSSSRSNCCCCCCRAAMENGSGDPFYAAKEEVRANFAQLQRLQHEWKQQLQTRGHPSKCTSLKSAIDSGLDALAADVRALDKAVAVAARHQQRLGLEAAEVESRRQFVQQQQQQLDALKADVKAALASQHPLAAAAPAVGVDSFFGDRLEQQQAQQDAQLDELAHAASRLHAAAITINQELETQQRMLTDLDDTLERQGKGRGSKPINCSSSTGVGARSAATATAATTAATTAAAAATAASPTT
ncbi:hypothetical protein ACSSS7_001211 [Eimeria intestinalis]